MAVLAMNTGPGRLLVFAYGVFAVSATARAGFQIVMKFDEAPLPYTLSAVAAVIYIVATIAFIRGDRTSWRVAVSACAIELIGVVTVGAITVADQADFPADTVWSKFGQGYGYVPFVLPILGLLWLRRVRQPKKSANSGADGHG